MEKEANHKGILVLAHGSRRAEAGDLVTNMVARLRADLDSDLVEPAFMELAMPDIPTSLAKLIGKGCQQIVVMCLFLVNGNHLVKDVPSLLEKALAQRNGVSFTLTPPLLQSPGMYHLVLECLQREVKPPKKAPLKSPAGIEAASFQIIDKRLGPLPFPPGESAVVKRVVHATADFSYALTLRFHGDPVTAGMRAIRERRPVIVDANMVRAGISANYPGEVLCRIQDMKGLSEARGDTRASLAMEQLADRMEGAIVAIGNAPTALLKVIELVETGRVKPALVVGVPVGLVGALEAKRRLDEMEGQPCITNLSERGGSAVAASIVNAIVKLAGCGAQERGVHPSTGSG
ncbi:MAG: precorrin-8X methylmutase [Dehalococcoidia bacterium]|nr:precorrin-8X methylmutase [Dehalococcoidia bacterium]